MEEERTHREIELRSEEVQEVMGKIPPAILRYGIVVLLGIMAVVLAGSACFSYPDTVETEFTLTTQNPPAYIMAQSAGRIEQLYTANSQPVGKGDMLGVIENVARTEDLFVLRERMKEWKQGGSRTEQVGTLFFHRIAELGSVQAAYSSCWPGTTTFSTCRKAGRMRQRWPTPWRVCSTPWPNGRRTIC